ncbi:MAG: hypothetical protein A2516_08970 [Alphaproteobacteria bacterium RIFOXYD12_FULL_60_8]|nr:MAG: hypothetical protein A2516_08970 [Alphaproteobacteria bacterium RIFOXYD12_FULL_60_8]
MPKYETLARRVAFENSKITVFADHISDGQGLEVRDYVVMAPRAKAEGMVTGVSVLPVSQGRIGLIRMYRHAVGATFWEVPRGFLDPGEGPDGSARRELEEETGLTCPPTGLVSLGSITQEASTIAARIALFAAKDCTVATNHLPHDELGLEEFRWFSFDEVRAMAADSRIEDACTLVCIFRYLNLSNS